MVSAAEFRTIALSLAGTTHAPHFDRTSFKVARTYATLGPSGTEANLKLTPDEQELKCMLAPELFKPLDNAWGRQGWTNLDVKAATKADVTAALEMAWRHALPPKRIRSDKRK